MRGVMRVAGVLVGTACSPKPPATPSATLLATWQTARVIMTLDDAPTGRRLRDNLTFTSAEPLGLAGP